MLSIKGIIRHPLEYIGGVIFSILAIVVFLQVVFRYIFHAPFSWPEEFARLCFVWASLIGTAIGVKNNSHFTVDIFTHNLQKMPKLVYLLFSDIIMLFLVSYWGWVGIKTLKVANMQTYATLRISMIWLYSSIPIACGIIFCILFRHISKTIKKIIYPSLFKNLM